MQKPSNGAGRISQQADPLVIHLPNGTNVAIETRDTNRLGRYLLRPGHRTQTDNHVLAPGCLDDGRPADLIQDPEDPEGTLFAFGDKGRARYQKTLEFGGHVFAAPRRCDPCLRHMNLPRGTQGYGSPSKLAGAVGDLLDVIGPFSDPLWATYVLHTWIYEPLAFSPCVVVVGTSDLLDPFLQALALVCRRALVIGDATPSALLQVSARFSPTLLVRDWGMSKGLMRILGMAARGNVLAMRGGHTSAPFLPRLLACSTVPSEPELMSNAIEVRLDGSDWPNSDRLSDPEVLKEAEHLRQCLLQFRFDIHDSVRPLRAKCPVGSRPKAWDIVRCLAAPFADDQEYCGRLFLQARTDWDVAPESISVEKRAVVAAVFLYVHHPKIDSVTVGDVAELARKALEQMNEPVKLGARGVGPILRDLGLTIRPRASCGYQLLLDEKAIANVHRWAKSYGVFEVYAEISQFPKVKCQHCREQGFVSKREIRQDDREIDARLAAAAARYAARREREGGSGTTDDRTGGEGPL